MAFPWCVMLVPEVEGKAKGAVLADAKWPRGSQIKISFLDGDPGLQARVKAVAGQWISRTGADLTFTWLNDPGAGDIRISFTRKGSWSLLGRYAKLKTDKTEPTMNFGWLTPNSTQLDIQEVVLHEFGHALGFIHEHQNPDGGLRWNRDAVIESLSGPPNEWTEQQIETNVLGHYDPRALIGTPFDPDSIMLYPFPAEWTENGVSTHNNSDLSTTDIRLARDIYA